MQIVPQDLTSRHSRGAKPRLVALLLILLASCSGCRLLAPQATWVNPEDSLVSTITCSPLAADGAVTVGFRGGASLTAAEESARRAVALEQAGQLTCVDAYYAATVSSYQVLVGGAFDPTCSLEMTRAWQLYHACLAKLVVTAERSGRLDPVQGLQVVGPAGPTCVGVDYHGFAWQPFDFNHFEIVGDYDAPALERTYRQDGLGVPLVVVRKRACQERFFRKQQPFPATVLLLPRAAVCNCGIRPESEAPFTLTFCNPGSINQVAIDPGVVPLAGDLTAPLALGASMTTSRTAIDDFLRPNDSSDEMQLVMLEPYQRGKIPIVFVHGLLSQPQTWQPLGNDLRSQPWFRQRYQVWAFRYPTGQPFLNSALDLRHELAAIISSHAEACDDPAASQIVLVGHSMGGLVSKLQITSSGDALWRVAANRPLEMINADPADRLRLSELFFFEPNPRIKQVIFVGTPHLGASMARRATGRISSALVRPDAEVQARHDRLIENNPGVFNAGLQRRVPTSIDLLEPDNPLLDVMYRLPVSPQVRMHSIIGTGGPIWQMQPSDGVVPVESARHPRVESELFVPARHTEVHHWPETVAEFERILQGHAAEAGSSAGS